MTLDGRLAKRLRDWQNQAGKLRGVIAALHPKDKERLTLETTLRRLELCINDLAADLMARSSPSDPPCNPDTRST